MIEFGLCLCIPGSLVEQVPERTVLLDTSDNVDNELRIVLSFIAETSRAAASSWNKTLIDSKLLIVD